MDGGGDGEHFKCGFGASGGDVTLTVVCWLW
jgi:hypothetical protein